MTTTICSFTDAQLACSPEGELQCAFGTCIDGVDGANATCSCSSGYEGTYCETGEYVV